MIGKDRKRGQTKFYQEDIVEQISAPGTYGFVLRCWHDEDIPMDSAHMVDPLMRPLARGEVGISFFPSGNRSILPESDFRLVDRSFHPGDLCKRSVDSVQSGVVTSIEVLGRLEHAVSNAPVQEWKNIADVRHREQAEVGDYVIYNDWVGQVIELYDESVIEMLDGELLRLPELSSHLPVSVGDKGSHILQPPPSMLGLLPNKPSSSDTVIAVLHTVLAIAWLAVNQSLDPLEAQSRRRPNKFWFGPDIAKLTLVPSRAEQLRVGEKLELSDATGLPSTVHGQEGGRPEGRITVQTFTVKETRTTVNVLWQDGSRETAKAADLIPYLNPDESDCWPGDHVLWKSEGYQRHAIVQSVNAAERTAAILFPDAGTKDIASLLELDPHGMSDPSTLHLSPAGDTLGVHRGDYVFIHRPGTTNDLPRPRVPYIGELEAWVREAPFNSEGKLTGWRREMSELGKTIASRRGMDNLEGQIRRLRKGDSTLSWFGEVVELRLDGTVEVIAPDFTTSVYPIDRLTKLYDGFEQIGDMWGDDVSEDHGSEPRDYDQMWAMDESGVWQPHNPEDDVDEWEETVNDEDLMEVDKPGWTSRSPDVRADKQRLGSSAPPSPSHRKVAHDVREPSTSVVIPPPPPSTSPSECALSGDHPVNGNDRISLKRFDVLPSTPPDHAFYIATPGQHTKSFLGRLAREYRVLQSSLPESIIVRAYEDRTDLLRSLIIGPENTPYENAPFVIDWMLDSNFPSSPPLAYFWSWTAGNGRVNPNLYEEGKVCLSILGTWGGDKNEVWSAARSSLLQALVSIQGLVLVKEPWFCEPAYEKLRGTEEGIVNSRLYSEKAYVLSRNFVRRALEVPLGGLEAEIQQIYYTSGLLEKVVHDAKALIAKSRSMADADVSEPDADVAIPRLSAGGIIMLERTLVKLQSLLDESAQS